MWPTKGFFGTFAAPSADFVAYAAHKRVWVWHACFGDLPQSHQM